MDNIPEFLLYLQQEANLKRENAGYAGSMNDGGASDLEVQIEVYRAGSSKRIPDVWANDFKQFSNKRDPEFRKYLELKQRFEE